MKRFLLNIFTIMAALTVLILTGCRTDYTKNAVERARTYALNNLKGLTDNQRNFIRFTQPEIYENIVYPRYVVPLDAETADTSRSTTCGVSPSRLSTT